MLFPTRGETVRCNHKMHKLALTDNCTQVLLPTQASENAPAQAEAWQMLIACQDALRMPDARLTGPRQGRAIRNANGKRGGAPLYIAAAAAPRRRRSAFRLFGFAAAATTFPHRFVTFRLGGNVILIVESTLARSECNKTEVFCGAAAATNDLT